MKKRVFVIVSIIILLVMYGFVYLFTVRLQTKLNTLVKKKDALNLENEALRTQSFYYSSPDRIDKIGREKYKMTEPKYFYIVEMNNGN